MLGSASGSLTSYPGHPPAAYGGLVSLVPDFILGPRTGARLRRAAVAWSKRYATRFFGTRSKVSMDWAASAIKFGHQVLKSTSGGRATCRVEWLKDKVLRGEAAVWGGSAEHFPVSVPKRNQTM